MGFWYYLMKVPAYLAIPGVWSFFSLEFYIRDPLIAYFYNDSALYFTLSLYTYWVYYLERVYIRYCKYVFLRFVSPFTINWEFLFQFWLKRRTRVNFLLQFLSIHRLYSFFKKKNYSRFFKNDLVLVNFFFMHPYRPGFFFRFYNFFLLLKKKFYFVLLLLEKPFFFRKGLPASYHPLYYHKNLYKVSYMSRPFFRIFFILNLLFLLYYNFYFKAESYLFSPTFNLFHYLWVFFVFSFIFIFRKFLKKYLHIYFLYCLACLLLYFIILFIFNYVIDFVLSLSVINFFIFLFFLYSSSLFIRLFFLYFVNFILELILYFFNLFYNIFITIIWIIHYSIYFFWSSYIIDIFQFLLKYYLYFVLFSYLYISTDLFYEFYQFYGFAWGHSFYFILKFFLLGLLVYLLWFNLIFVNPKVVNDVDDIIEEKFADPDAPYPYRDRRFFRLYNFKDTLIRNKISTYVNVIYLFGSFYLFFAVVFISIFFIIFNDMHTFYSYNSYTIVVFAWFYFHYRLWYNFLVRFSIYILDVTDWYNYWFRHYFVKIGKSLGLYSLCTAFIRRHFKKYSPIRYQVYLPTLIRNTDGEFFGFFFNRFSYIIHYYFITFKHLFFIFNNKFHYYYIKNIFNYSFNIFSFIKLIFSKRKFNFLDYIRFYMLYSFNVNKNKFLIYIFSSKLFQREYIQFYYFESFPYKNIQKRINKRTSILFKFFKKITNRLFIRSIKYDAIIHRLLFGFCVFLNLKYYKSFSIKRYITVKNDGNDKLKELMVKRLNVSINHKLLRFNNYFYYFLFRPRTNVTYFHGIYWAPYVGETKARQYLVPGQGGNLYMEPGLWYKRRHGYLSGECRAIMYYFLKQSFKGFFYENDPILCNVNTLQLRGFIPFGSIDGIKSKVTDWYTLEFRLQKRFLRIFNAYNRINNWSYKRKDLPRSRSLLLYWDSMIYFNVFDKFAYTGLGSDGRTVINE